MNLPYITIQSEQNSSEIGYNFFPLIVFLQFCICKNNLFVVNYALLQFGIDGHQHKIYKILSPLN